MRKNKFSKGLIVFALLILLYEVFLAAPTLSAGFTGTFRCYGEVGNYYIAVIPREEVFYLYNTKLNLYRKGNYVRLSLEEYVVDGENIDKQNLELDNQKFIFGLNGMALEFEKISNTPVLANKTRELAE